MRKYFIFSVICVAMLLISINAYSVSVAIPDLISELHTTLLLVGLVLTVFSLVTTVVASLSGRISEITGSRNMFIICTLLFSTGSVLCAVSPNVYLLITARVIQALGAGGIVPCGTGIVVELFPNERQRYIGLVTNLVPIGMIIGPNVGGWLVEAFGWRATFWFNVPFGFLVIVLLWLLHQGSAKKATRPPIDLGGAGLLFVAISALMFGITELGNNKTGTPWALVAMLVAAGIVFGTLFVRWERRSRKPIVELALLGDRPFLAANLYNFIYGACSVAVRTLIPLYAVTLYGMSTIQSGVLLTPWSVTMIVASTLVSLYMARWGYRWPMLVGTIVLTLGFGLIGLEPQGLQLGGLQIGSTPVLYIIMALCGIGTGVIAPVSNNVCIELMPDKVVAIAGVRNVFRSLGSAAGIGIATVSIYAIGDMRHAFSVVLIVTALVTFASLPFVYLMPASANVKPVKAG